MLKSFILFVFGYGIISNNLIALEQQKGKMQNVKINNDKKYNYKSQQENNVFHLPPINQDKLDNATAKTEKKNLSANNLNIKHQNNTDKTKTNNENIVVCPKQIVLIKNITIIQIGFAIIKKYHHLNKI